MIEVRRYQLHDGRVGVARTCLFRLCVYVGRHGTTLVIPLFGGDKRTPEADIRGAKEYWVNWKRVRRMRRTGSPRGVPRIDSEQATPA